MNPLTGNAAIVAAALCVSACAFSPTSKQAAAFGTTATAALTAVQNARTADLDLNTERGVELRACRYLQSGAIDLSGPLPGKGTPLLNDQLNLLNAMTDYAKALASATDPAAVANLEAAASKLPGAVTSLAGSLPSATTSPLLGPSIKLVSAVAVDLVELDTREQLRRVIQNTDPVLQAGAIKLLEDWPRVVQTENTLYSRWAKAKTCDLADMRADPRSVKSDLYANYKDADER